jgi:HD-like signal output (HDOD) protein
MNDPYPPEAGPGTCRLAINTIAAKIVTLPVMTFPRTLGKIDRLLGDAKAKPGVAASVLASDPLLSALILGRANAASGQDLTQVGPAMGVLGVATVHELIRGTAPLPREHLAAMSACWSLANACGTMCRILGRRSAVAPAAPRDEGTLHTLGLLHDLGTIAAILHFPAAYARTSERLAAGEGFFHDLLKQDLGASPGKLGALWGRALNLPSRLTTPIRFQMRPLNAESEPELCALLHVARILVRACGHVVGQDIHLEEILPETLAMLGLAGADLEAAIEEFFREMEELELYEGALIG